VAELDALGGVSPGAAAQHAGHSVSTTHLCLVTLTFSVRFISFFRVMTSAHCGNHRNHEKVRGAQCTGGSAGAIFLP